jgi:hypothetical protein
VGSIIKPEDYLQGLLGGSSPNRVPILHWNVRSINVDEREKMAFLRLANPIVASIQESRKQITPPDGFVCHHAIPRTTRDEGLKINSALLVSTDVTVTVSLQEIDQIAVVLTGKNIGSPLLAVSVYLHTNEGILSNLEQLSRVSLCIQDFRELHPSGRVLVMGDFNMDISQLEAHRPEPGVSTLLRMQHYLTGPTARTQIRKSQIERQIDHLFSDFPL